MTRPYPTALFSMAEVDPDEEFARQLHREMNGLNRIRRGRAARPLPPGKPRGSTKDATAWQRISRRSNRW